MKKANTAPVVFPRVFATALASVTLLSLTQAAPVYLEQGGRVVIEAEHFSSRTANADGHHWHITPDEDVYPSDLPPTIHNNARGTQIICLPDNGVNHSATANWNTGPFVDYTFRVETLGTYRLWLRWRGWDANADSLYAQMVGKSDGTNATGNVIADWYNYFGNSGAGFNGNWRGSAVKEVVTAAGTAVDATWDITTPGNYTVRVTYREDGCSLDTICLQLTSLAAPTDPGPAESLLLLDEPFVWARTPGVNAANVFPHTPYQVQIRDGGTLALSSEDPLLLLNGTALAITKSKTGPVTTLNAASAGMLARGSTNTLTLIYKDTANTSYTNAWEFVASQWTVLPPTFKINSAQVSTDPGFTVNVHQVQRYDSNSLPVQTSLASTIDRAEGQIRACLFDPATGMPYTNNISPGTGIVFGDGFDDVTMSIPETYVNWNIRPSYGLGGADFGNFRYDSLAPNGYGFPDIMPPGYNARVDTTFTNNYAYEIITYLDLPAGLTRLGVNSDDGFRLTCGLNYRERYDTNKVLVLGEFDGGRSSTDSLFDIMVAEAGIYPIRLLHFQTGGDASLEFFHMTANGTRIPINDIPYPASWQTGNPSAIKAYRSATLTRSAVIDWLSPAPGAMNVATGAVIQAQLCDGPNGTVNQASIRLLLNGSLVTPQVTTDGPRTRLAYEPVPPLAYGTTNFAQIEFMDSLGGSITQAWQFTMVTNPPPPPPQGELVRKLWPSMTAGTIAAFRTWSDFTNNVNYNINGEPTIINAFETPQSSPAIDNYGQHLIGYLKPEATDWYTFYTASDDHSELWLSTNSLPEGQAQIAFMRFSSGYREFATGRDVYNRRSQPIFLQAGQRYFVQAFHRDGTGGDFFSVAWWRTNTPPVTNGTPGISGAVLEKFVGAAFAQQPASLTLIKGRTAVFSTQPVVGVGTVSYQWWKGTSPISGATELTYTIPAVQVADAGSYRLRITVDGVPYDSAIATLTVIDDSTPPVVLSARGMNDAVQAAISGPAHTIAIEFNEEMDLNSLNSANIELSGGLFVNERGLGYSNRVVLLKANGPIPASFSVTVSGLGDPAGNLLPAGTVINGSLAPLTPMLLGTAGVDPIDSLGTVAYGLNNGYLVVANGSDLYNAADAGHFAYTTWTGNFDAQVRVESISRANDWSKAGIMAREDLTPGSRNVMTLVTPQPLNNLYNVQWRDAINGGSGSKATAERLTGVTYPNAWIRLTRANSTFVAYIKTNGVDWVPYHRYVAPSNYPATIYVGLATTSHDNVMGDLTTAVYRDFSVQNYSVSVPGVSGYSLQTNGAFGITVDAPVGQSYTVIASTNLSLPMAQWTVVQGGLVVSAPFTVFDTAATNYPTRFYRVISP